MASLQGHCGGVAASHPGGDRQKAGEREEEEEERHCATRSCTDLPLHGAEWNLQPEVSFMRQPLVHMYVDT